ncbi:MAG: RNA-binding S4 domain-containing protein [Sphingobacteriaceae bacterium]|nr:RNA-binding S4 domain-containing protein [Sphingobacteriaceae bacterium]
MIKFKLETEFIPLIGLLKATGLVQSGGEAQTVVENGEVKCNGEIDYRKRLKVRVGDRITFNNTVIEVI